MPSSLFPGIRVDETPPIAKKGKAVRLRWHSHREAVNAYQDEEVVLTLRPVTKK